jgi:hypothetical protein
MNPDTRIAVCCYEGDKQQVEQSLDFYLHHQCPVTILSPENSKVVINHPGVDNRHAGLRGRSGPDAHARHLEHLKILLTYPENHFFMHESDSVCLDPKIPDYLYAEPHIVWTNEGRAMETTVDSFPPDCPPLSFQAPWFLSRKTIEAFVAVAPQVPHIPQLEWVDNYLVQLTYAAKLPHKGFRDRYLGPISGRYDEATGKFFTPFGAGVKGDPICPELAQIYNASFAQALEYVNNGANMIHSVKNSIAAKELLVAYQNRKKS